MAMTAHNAINDAGYRAKICGMQPKGVILGGVGPDGNVYPASINPSTGALLTAGGGAATQPTTGATNQMVPPTGTAIAIPGLGLDSTRKGVTITNTDTINNIYIGFSAVDLSTTGHILLPYGTYSPQTTAALFAQASAGTPRLSWAADKA